MARSSDTEDRSEIVGQVNNSSEYCGIVSFIDISASTEFNVKKGVGVAVSRLLRLSELVYKNLQEQLNGSEGIRFRADNIVKSIGDELMIAIDCTGIEQDKVARALSCLLLGIETTIDEALQKSKEALDRAEVSRSADEEHYICKAAVGLCDNLISGETIRQILVANEHRQRFLQRVFMKNDFWGVGVNETARIASFSENKVILVNEAAYQLLKTHHNDAFSFSGVYSFKAKGLGKIGVSQVIPNSSVPRLPELLFRYRYCCLFFLEVKGMSRSRDSTKIKTAETVTSRMQEHFPRPMLAFSYLLSEEMGESENKNRLDMMFGLIAQDFEDYQERIENFISSVKEMPPRRVGVGYPVTYPLWRPFSSNTGGGGLEHPFFRVPDEHSSLQFLPASGIVSVVSFGSMENANRFKATAHNVYSDQIRTSNVWTVLGDSDTVSLYSVLLDEKELDEGGQEDFENVIQNEIQDRIWDVDDRVIKNRFRIWRCLRISPSANGKD